MTELQAWVGRSETRYDVLEPTRSRALTTALGGVSSDDYRLPHLHHWLYFWDVVPPSGLGQDGHPAKGGFLPPVPLPRRMWAGGRLRFLAPLKLGDAVEKSSTILAVTPKSARSGELCFVTVRHRISGPEGLAIEEEQDLVYRAAADGPAPLTGPTDEAPFDWEAQVPTDPVLLFRYSALTLNGHRIHYDRPYAETVEHYPGLVVQGPLLATLLLSQAQRQRGRSATSFAFRGVTAAIEGSPLTLRGQREETMDRAWISQDGRLIQSAQVGWEPTA